MARKVLSRPPRRSPRATLLGVPDLWFALLRVARTIAYLEGKDVIDGHAIAEAVQYRWWAGIGREDSRLD